MDLTPKQQTSEAIRQANSILLVTGQHPSNDQVVSVWALAAVLRKLGKKVSAVVSDSISPALNFVTLDPLDNNLDGLRDFILKVDLAKAEVDKLKYNIEGSKLNIHIIPFRGKFTPGDVTYSYGDYHYDLAVVLGVPSRTRIDQVFLDNPSLFETVPIANIDFHRSNENYGAINLIDPYASSLSEMIVALAESLQTGIIDEPIATALLTGIISSTDRFTASHTTPKSLTVAAQLMAAGAKQQTVVKSLYKSTERKPRSNPALASAPAAVKTEEALPPSPLETPPAPNELTTLESAEA